MKKLFVLCTMLLWVAINALAQQKISVSGIVTDENKEPVIGANVSVKDVPDVYKRQCILFAGVQWQSVRILFRQIIVNFFVDYIIWE